MTTTTDIIRLPYAFSQTGLLETSKFCQEAKAWSTHISIDDLRELHRIGLLDPLFHIRDRRSPGTPFTPAPIPEWCPPRSGFSRHDQACAALDRHRLVDPGLVGYKNHHPFTRRVTTSYNWWNGYLYSSWQLLVLPALETLLASKRILRRGERVFFRYDKFRIDHAMGHAMVFREIAIVLGAIEGRYMPTINPDWIKLRGSKIDEWRNYRARFSAKNTADALGIEIAWIESKAELLLAGDAPLGKWAELAPFAKSDSLTQLTGSNRSFIVRAQGAELLLQFRSDLEKESGKRSEATIFQEHRRFTPSDTGLDHVLADLGLSPHPGVVLAVEGATEAKFIANVWAHLGLKVDRSLVLIVNQRGGDKQMDILLTAFSPILGEERTDGWDLVRPPTRLVVVSDPSKKWPIHKRTTHLRSVLSENIVAQGGQPIDEGTAEMLIGVEEWGGPCFEFAHFSDEELSTAVNSIRPGYTTSGRMAAERESGRDLHHAWDGSGPPMSKLDLADVLWPVLANEIDDALNDEGIPLPQVAQIALDAHSDALNLKARKWALPRPKDD